MKDEDKVKGVCVLLNLFLNIKVTKSDRMKLIHSNRRTQALAQTNTSFSCLSTPLIPALNCRDPEWQTVAPPSNPNQKIYLIHTPTNPHLHTHTYSLLTLIQISLCCLPAFLHLLMWAVGHGNQKRICVLIGWLIG